jgi:hypothetical protein
MTSSPLRGSVTTARSSWPEPSWSSSWALDPSATLRWMWGGGPAAGRRAVAPASGRWCRSCPGAPCRPPPGAGPLTSATMSESSFMIRRARPTTTSPSSVRRPEDRSTNCTCELTLEAGDMGRHVGLNRPDRRGGRREAAGVGDAQECLQMFQLHEGDPFSICLQEFSCRSHYKMVSIS